MLCFALPFLYVCVFLSSCAFDGGFYSRLSPRRRLCNVSSNLMNINTSAHSYADPVVNLCRAREDDVHCRCKCVSLVLDDVGTASRERERSKLCAFWLFSTFFSRISGTLGTLARSYAHGFLLRCGVRSLELRTSLIRSVDGQMCIVRPCMLDDLILHAVNTRAFPAFVALPHVQNTPHVNSNEEM